MAELKNISGCILIDGTAAFLNGAGLGAGEDKNKMIPKTMLVRTSAKRKERIPYVSAQSWRRWLRNTTNEENHWSPSELRAIGLSEKKSTNKIATELNPIDYPEDDIFGYMKSGGSGEESVQRTSPFKTSVLRGLPDKGEILTTDDAFVHLKEGAPLPYSTTFYNTFLEGFFNLEYYRLGMYDNLASKVELSSDMLDKYKDVLEEQVIYGKFKRYILKNAEMVRKERAAGLLKGLVYLRGGAKQAAFGSDVAPKVIILAGMESANPVFNGLFDGANEKPMLKTEVLLEIAGDYKEKLTTPIYVGIRSGFLANNEDDLMKLRKSGIVVDSPVAIVNRFIEENLR